MRTRLKWGRRARAEALKMFSLRQLNECTKPLRVGERLQKIWYEKNEGNNEIEKQGEKWMRCDARRDEVTKSGVVGRKQRGTRRDEEEVRRRKRARERSFVPLPRAVRRILSIEGDALRSGVDQ